MYLLHCIFISYSNSEHLCIVFLCFNVCASLSCSAGFQCLMKMSAQQLFSVLLVALIFQDSLTTRYWF